MIVPKLMRKKWTSSRGGGYPQYCEFARYFTVCGIAFSALLYSVLRHFSLLNLLVYSFTRLLDFVTRYSLLATRYYCSYSLTPRETKGCKAPPLPSLPPSSACCSLLLPRSHESHGRP